MKRGTSGLSLLIGVNKPSGLSSHDVVNRCRGIFEEKRIGHTGTLDPLASGVLPICIGPAARLDKYLVGHEKSYRAIISFGRATNTDDSEGEVVQQLPMPDLLQDVDYARAALLSTVGKTKQVPPAYCAVKINGKPAYKRARSGEDVEIAAREVEVYSADLVSIVVDVIEGFETVDWVVDYSVSKGTYIRSLARDLGEKLGTCAHMSGLQRLRAGRIDLSDCFSLDSVAEMKAEAALDPIRVLGFRWAFGDDRIGLLRNGGALPADALKLYQPLSANSDDEVCTCMPHLNPSSSAPFDGELISVVAENKLKAVYKFDSRKRIWVPDCIFSIGVSRG
jgi:tRNA pseudouridine55 synthase